MSEGTFPFAILAGGLATRLQPLTEAIPKALIDVNGSIVAYDKEHRTPRMRHIDYGLGVFAAAAFDRVPEGRPHDLATLYRELLQQGHVVAYEVTQRFYEIGSAEGLEETRRYLGSGAARRVTR